jgi:hypothetical protein
MSNASDDEPEIVVIASKEVVIRTEPKSKDAKTKKHASTSNQKMMNDTTDVFKMILTTNGVVDLGD